MEHGITQTVFDIIGCSFFSFEGLKTEKAPSYCIILLQEKTSYFVSVLCMNFCCFGNWNARSFVSDDKDRLYFRYEALLFQSGGVCWDIVICTDTAERDFE
jgi:hypothetical protein